MSNPAEENPRDIVRNGYDAIAYAYLDFVSGLPSPSLSWIDRLLNLLPDRNNTTVLELGCGPGIPSTQHLARHAGIIVANDISPAQIDLAREKLSSLRNVSYMVGDMTRLTFGRGLFGAITALYSLQHLPRDEQPLMLRSIHDWLAPGGLLLCNFDRDEEPAEIMANWLGARMYRSGFGVEGSKQLVVQAGFELIETEVVSVVDGKNTVPFLWILARKMEVL